VQHKLAEAGSFLWHLVRATVLLTPTGEDHKKASRRILRYPDQDISQRDALGAEICERLDVPLWTYDYHFDIMGARV
jgi:hypothetical protein